jgi:hypothetical protein
MSRCGVSSARHKPSVRTEIPFLRVTPGGVYRYSIWDPPYIPDQGRMYRPGMLSLDALQAQGKDSERVKNYPGKMTATSRRSMVRAINLLLAISLPKKAVQFKTGKEFTFRVNFITLTLPAPQGDVTDEQLKRGALKSWLEYWRREAKGMSYVWRAERQGNGNLHFHITTDRYILYTDLRDTWNNRLNSLGFIDNFEAKHGHRFPNSTDVHAVAHIRNLASYIAKYMSKQDKDTDAIDGRVWDCSTNLKAKHRCEYIVDTDLEEIWSSLIKKFPNRQWSTDFAAGVWLTESQMKKHLPERIQSDYAQWLESIRNPQGYEKNSTGIIIKEE